MKRDRTLLTINTPKGRRRVTADNLIKGLTVFKRQHDAQQARAFDSGVQAAKHIVANNALADALRANASNQTANRTARAIDSLFDPAPAPAVKNQPLLDAIDGIVPHQGPAMSIDQAIDGQETQPSVSIAKFVQEI